MAVLQVLKGMTPGQVFPLGGERMVMGRHPDCDIVLDVGAVSRQHAVVVRMNNEFYVEDLKSRNGTFVNGEVVHGRRRLQENDRVKVCDIVFAFHAAGPNRDGTPTVSDTAPDDNSRATFIDDIGARASGTIMSSIDVQANRSGFQISVNPELKLQALLEITRNLASSLDLNSVLGKVIDSLFKIFIQADRGFVVLRDPDTGALIPKAVKYRRGDDAESIRISRTIVNQVMSSKEAILSADAAGDTRFDGSQSIADFRIRSMMCAPLLDTAGEALGVIQIDTLDQRSRFQTGDLEVLAGVAYQAAFAIENAQLHDVALKKQAFERDLDLAHKVQRGFLPDAPPAIDGYEFFDFYEAANQIGGDYFDYVPLPGGRLAVVLGDVAGKGMPAALLMAKLSSDVRYSLATGSSPADAVNKLNAAFARGDFESRFVTLVAVVLDCQTHEAIVVNAGHMSPYLRTCDGQILKIGEEEKGLPLGVIDDAEFQTCSVTLKPGETLTIYTDGINEAMNAANELYGFERLEKLVIQDLRPISAYGKSILDDVNNFVGKRAQSDDRCLICFGRTK
ncbi:MAG: SpoIIE family protein phosphatase [Planctomycetes bacterium]|nr:SpoIIE family protein phosphatase [Planctomycetota bacterium]